MALVDSVCIECKKGRKVDVKVDELCRCKSRPNPYLLKREYILSDGTLSRSISLSLLYHVYVYMYVYVYIYLFILYTPLLSSLVAKIQAKRQNPISTIHIRLKHIKWACSGAQSKYTASSSLSICRVHVGPRH